MNRVGKTISLAMSMMIMCGATAYAQPLTQLASSPTTIVTSDVENTADDLSADYENAEYITMSNENNQVKITESGTYVVSGTCEDGNITVKKGLTGVVLVLKDLDLTSTTGATLSCNKTSEVQIIVNGTVNLTDAENIEDENSSDEEVADAFDGAAIKAKDGSNVYLTGNGTLNLTSVKNGIKVGDENTPSFVIDGDITVNINADNDGINGGYDITVLSGTLNISAGDDGIHADRILTLGDDSEGPTVTVNKSYEGLEGTVVNLFNGEGTINASDDGINAANSDGTYSDELDFSINITGGTWNVKCSGDGLDSNGNVNITGGKVTINSGSTGGEAGIDYDGSCYIANGTVTNYSGISGPDGEMNGQTTAPQGQMEGQPTSQGQMTPPTNDSKDSAANEQNSREAVSSESEATEKMAPPEINSSKENTSEKSTENNQSVNTVNKESKQNVFQKVIKVLKKNFSSFPQKVLRFFRK